MINCYARATVRWLLVGCWLLLTQAHAQTQKITIQEAGAVVTVSGESTVIDKLPLPFSWDKRQGAVAGQAVLSLRFSAKANGRDLGMYIPKLGNTFAIRLNAREIARYGTLPPNLYADSGRDPQYFVLPAALVERENVLEISLGAVGGRLAGLSQVTVGEQEQVYPLFREAYFWQVNVSQFVVIISAVLGLLSMLLWVKQRDVIYLYYGLGELLWSLQTLRVLLEHPPLPWPWWGLLPLAAFNLACPLLIKFAMATLGHRRGWVNRLADFLLICAVPAAAIVMLGGILWVIPLFQGLLVVMCVGMFIEGIPKAMGTKRSEKRVMGIAIALVVACVIRDFLMLRFADDTFALLPWTRFAWVAFGVSMAWIIAERLRRAEQSASKSKEVLEARLAARDIELRVTFERDKQVARETGVTQERARLIRDLHDGLGSHLVGALRISQKSEVPKEELTAQLREAIDQLKMTVDANQEVDGDVPAILGAVRYRLASRLEAAGITLKWDVARLDQMEDWGVQQAYHLQMLLYEAFTNLIVHSGATHAGMIAQIIKQANLEFLQIELTDNGKGFDIAQAERSPGKGLSNMAMRAKELGAQMTLSSSPGATKLSLVLKLIK